MLIKQNKQKYLILLQNMQHFEGRDLDAWSSNNSTYHNDSKVLPHYPVVIVSFAEIDIRIILGDIIDSQAIFGNLDMFRSAGDGFVAF